MEDETAEVHKRGTQRPSDVSPRRHHLQQLKGGRYRYRRRWPTHLRPFTEGEYFIRHLHTSDLDEAIRLRPGVETLYLAEVDRLERMRDAAPRPLTEAEATSLVVRWYLERDADLAEQHRDEPTPAEIREEAIQGAEHGLRFVTEKLATGDIEAVTPLARRLLSEYGVEADESSKGYRELLQLLLRANVVLTEADLARYRGDFGYQPRDPIFAAALEVGHVKEAPRRTVSMLIEAYTADKNDKWSASTRAAYGPVCRLLRDVLGNSRDVATLRREEGRLLYDTAKALPKNLGKVKALAGLSVPKAVERGRELGLPVIGPGTVNDVYLALLKSIFKWAVQEQWMEANPLAGLTVADPVADEDKRDPFTVEQLRVLFGQDPWRPRDDDPAGRPGRFWVPLLCLFQGLRLSEAAGLRVEDVGERDGFPMMVMRGFEVRKLKTESSRGEIPIHPELIRIGFLEHVRARRRAGESMLFPDVRVNANGKMGAKLGEWFSKLVKKRGLVGTKLGMHSFRHNFEDRLREAELAERTALALARRQESGSSKTYGHGLSMRRKSEAIAKIVYPGLDLSHLHIAQGSAE